MEAHHEFARRRREELTKVRLGVIGVGLAFRELHLPVLVSKTSGFEIVALTSRSVESARRVAADLKVATGIEPAVFASYQELLASGICEAVDIAVPIALTAQVVRAALEAGCHVFAEKPLADTVAECRSLIAMARSRAVTLMVGENFRYQPRFRQCRRLVSQGVIGRPILYRLNDMHYTALDSKYASTSWRLEGQHRGGYLVDGGTHIVAGMRVMVDSPVTEVHGLSACLNPALSNGQPDTLLLQIRFENGVIGQMTLGYSGTDRESRKPKIYGDAGTLVLFSDHIEAWMSTGEVRTIPLESTGHGFEEEWADFHAAITKGASPAGTAEEALLDLAVIEAGLTAAQQRRCVLLDALGQHLTTAEALFLPEDRHDTH
jgi:predicted dehydrogenase